MEIKKIFSPAGITGIKEIYFKNLSNGSGINLIYFTNVTNIAPTVNDINGVSFLNTSKNKTYFNIFILPPSFIFYNHRVSTLNYTKFFKTIAPKKGINGRIVKTIPLTKTDQLSKSTFYDLTSLGETFKKVSSISEIKSIQELMKTFEKIAVEFSKTYYKKDTYILLETDFNNKEILELLLKYYRIKNTLIDLTGIPNLKGIIVKVKNIYFPLTEIKSTTLGDILTINLQALHKIEKHLEKDIEVLPNSPKIISDEHVLESKESKESKELLKKLEDIKQLTSDAVTDDIKINTILNDTNQLINRSNKNILKNPKLEKYKKELSLIKELNFKFNGSIKVSNENLPKNLYYDPVKATGIETYTGYNKQKTEFDEVLDEAMFDLFKSLEIDDEVGLKVQKIKISFEDNIKNRFKIYKIKLKNTKFGYNKPYDIELRVPYPIQGKYIKLDSNKYIMQNQFFPYPILKIQPDTVRIYTHFSTAAVELKGGIVSTTSDLNRIKDKFLIKLTEYKKKVKTQNLTITEIDDIKNKYGLPKNLNDSLFTNIEIR